MADAKKTMDDIADSLISNVVPLEGEPDEDVVESNEAEGATESDEAAEAEGATEPDEATENDADDEVDEVDEDEGTATAGVTVDEEPYLDVTDEDLIEVKVDGEVVYRSIADAKKALSGEGAIEKRLKDATLAKQSAMAEQADGIRALEAERTQLLDMVNQLDAHIFQPSVQMPTNEMRQQDPNMYLQELDAYNADQARIRQARSQLSQNIDKQKQERAANMGVIRQQNEIELVRKIPALAEPDKVSDIMSGIVQVGKSYGFNDKEIAEFFDHRSYYMAYDLMQAKAELARIKGGAKVVPKTVDDNVSRVPRRLRSGVAKKKMAAKSRNKARKARYDKAKSTGKVDDVVQTILKAR